MPNVDAESSLFDLYTRSADHDEWSVVDRCMPEQHAEERAERLRREGRQAKIEPSDPNYRPSYNAILLNIADQLSRQAEAAANAIRLYVAGDDGQSRTVRDALTLLELHAKSLWAYFGDEHEQGQRGTLGITLASVNDAFVIAALENSGPAGLAGLKVNDRLISINKFTVTALGAGIAMSWLDHLVVGDRVDLGVERDREILELSVTAVALKNDET